MDFETVERAIADYTGQFAQEQNISAKTRKNRRLFTTRLSSFLHGRKLDFLSCRDFLNELRKTNETSSMQQYVKSTRAFIHFCVAYDYLSEDFSKKLVMPKTITKNRFLVSEEDALRAIQKGTEPSHSDNRYAKKSKVECRIALHFALYTGLRNKEIRKLQVQDFNLSEKTFLVHSKGQKEDLANIPWNMVEQLREWIAYKKTGQMFQVTEDALRQTYTRGLEKLGLPHQRVHDLRHVYALTRLKRREPLQLVSRTLRHTSSKITDQYYSHYLVSDLTATVNNSPEIQKSLPEESVIDGIQKLIQDFGVPADGRFRIVRTAKGINVESVAFEKET